MRKDNFKNDRLIVKSSIGNRKLFRLLLFLFFSSAFVCFGQSNDDCLICHDDPTLYSVTGSRRLSRYVKPDALLNSVHESIDCASCHQDAVVEDYPHPEKLQEVDCGFCHDEEKENFLLGVHGKALMRKNRHAPACKDCHGTHQILKAADPRSLTYKMNIPVLCGLCHQEGAPVANNYNISEHNIIENYSQGIHGKGLFKSGLTVTATCNNCHGNHLILPHTDLRSRTSQKNIAQTCMQCHARIEDVHVKVINKELWEKKPGAIPACTDCHPPHKVELKNILETISDQSCLTCHEKESIFMLVDKDTVSLTVDVEVLAQSSHNNITCVKCHSDVTANSQRPCETAGKVDCSNCHAEEADVYFSSGHGVAYFNKHENAPYCTDCHGTHLVKLVSDESAEVFRSSIPTLCGSCHRENGKAPLEADLKEKDALADYSTSVHGKSLEEKGLLSVAVCIDCHTAHFELKESDPRSSVYPANLAKTCGRCHKGIYDAYRLSDHAYHESKDKIEFPTCETCHTAHHISEVHQDRFMTEITAQCGKCHKELAATYMETYHGKAYQLGYLDAARCSDCHGAHNIYRMDNPNSTIGPRNIVQTCRKCHTDANMKFTGYLTHATHYDRSKFPWLYYTFWAMTALLFSVFAFFGLHTLLWLPRSIGAMIQKRKHTKIVGKQVYIRRFSKSQRITHIFVITSFVLLALTGMMLKFAHMEWARFLAKLIGGAYIAGVVHRIAAVVTFGYFIFHVSSLLKFKREGKLSLGKLIFNGSSLMFNRQDVRDFWASIKWFIGIGPKPAYGRWTYWEKFDYFAVFWGVVVIGTTGLMLWFPEFFTRIFPGWLINVAQIIHSDEALLAVGFIFTIHFFNTHLRPEAFPMDTVIFTGYLPVEELKKERPREYQRLKDSGRLEKEAVELEFSAKKLRLIKFLGAIALILGIVLVILIIYSLVFH